MDLQNINNINKLYLAALPSISPIYHLLIFLFLPLPNLPFDVILYVSCIKI